MITILERIRCFYRGHFWHITQWHGHTFSTWKEKTCLLCGKRLHNAIPMVMDTVPTGEPLFR